MNSPCSGCKKAIKPSERITCTQSSCGKRYHYLCVNLNVDNFKKQKYWKCPDCSIKHLSIIRKEGNSDDTPIKLATSSEFLDDSQNITIRRQKESEPTTEHQDCVSRAELAEIIRRELRSVIRDTLNEEFANIKKEIHAFEETIKFINSQYDAISTKVKVLSDDTKIFSTTNAMLTGKVSDLEERLSQMEQSARQSNVEIHCLPEHRQENLVNTIVNIGKVISFPILEADILSCNRVQKLNASSKLPRTVVCKLTSKIKRDNFLGAVLTYNKMNPKNKLNTKILGYGDIESPVFINEHLTPSNKALHAATRLRAKEKQYKFVWVRNGKIFVRKNETSPARVITRLEALENLS
ncbi:unnamed protein product [Parnassius mnemosyne]|uniref:Zinc finger PHD-type domain-containing protein n=1 Tax=Parnassius mnemosyne TaxID=213953 RepID=A0AAV1LC11_9NEOP